MKPIIQKIWIFIAMLWISSGASAYDTFSSGYLNYEIVSEEDRTVKVVTSYIEGNIEIPQKVINNSKTYTVVSIGDYAFSYCYLASITIPSSVTSIGDEAFRGGYIENINVDSENACYSSIDGILYNKDATTFLCCPVAKTSVTIPSSVTSIGNYAFYNCSSLTSVTIPSSVTSIGDGAFTGCSNLENINVDSENACYSSIDGILYNKDATTLLCCPVTKTSVTIPNSVTSIGNYAFFGCSSLTSVTIPNAVTSIGNEAFSYCSSLTSVTIPNSVTSIEDKAFYDCSRLTSVTIPNSVTSIGEGAFDGCRRLTSVTIPNSVTSIGSYAFSSCDRLTSVTLPNSVTSIGDYTFRNCDRLTSVTIPNSVTSIGNYAFCECYTLTSVTIPNSVTSIGEGAFTECYTLTSVTIPNSVISIGDKAFYYCDRLTSVTIPNSVISIGDKAFYKCNLKNIYAQYEDPLEFGSIFSNKSYTGAVLYVPAGTIEAYKNTDPWRNFRNIEEMDPVAAETISLNKTTISLKINETYQLAATVSPDNTTNKTVTWSSSDDRIAKVSDTGLVTGVSAGEAVIKSSCGDISAECKVSVSETTGIEEIATSPDSRFDIYNINGIMIKKGCSVDDLHRLPKGIYIVVSESNRYKIAI